MISISLRSLTICLILLLLGTMQSFSQEADLMSSIADQLEIVVNGYVRESVISSNYSHDTAVISTLFSQNWTDSTQMEAADREKLAEIELLRKDKGLSLTSTYSNNVAGAIVEEDGTFYDWKTNAGVEWNILRNGFIDNKHRTEQRRLEWEADRAMQETELKSQLYRHLYNHLIYVFNQRKIDVIHERLEILRQLEDAVTKLYYMRYVHWEDVLSVMSSKTETELFLQNFQTYVRSVRLDTGFVTAKFTSLPVFDLQYDRLSDSGLDTSSQHKAMEMKVAALDHQFHWSKDYSLNANLRYNYYSGSSTSIYDRRDFLAAGITLGIPLSFNRNEKDELRQAKEKKIRTDYEFYYDGLENDVLNHYYEYQYALKQYVGFHYKRERIAVAIKRAIRQRNLDDPDYSPKMVVGKLDELFSVDLELIDIQQRMYLKALKIFSMINAQDVLNLIEIKDFNNLTNQFVGHRTVMCTAEDLALSEVKYLVEVLKYNDIAEVVVEVEDDLDLYIKYAELLNASQRSALKVRLSISGDKVITTNAADLQSALDLILTPLVHIDLSELSTLSSDKSNLVIKKFEELFREQGRSFDIAISVPSDLDIVQLGILTPYVSVINLVPVNRQALPALYHQVKALGALGKKVKVTLRPGEYLSRMELDHNIEEIMEHLEIDQVVIWGVEELINLDKQTIGWHEERRF